jgi:hypothetical protein
MTALRPTRPRRLTPQHGGGASPQPPALAHAIAIRLAVAHHGESVRTLEALAAAEANRRRRCSGVPAVDDGAAAALDATRFARCRRIARRVLAGTTATPADRAAAYHRETARPAWAAGRTPVAELGDFVFYAPDSGACD